MISRIYVVFLLVVSLFLCMLTLPGCDTKKTIIIEELNNMELAVEASEELTVITEPSDTTISAASADESIATVVSSGNPLTVTGVAAGTAAITVKAEKEGYQEALSSFNVTVTDLEVVATPTATPSPGEVAIGTEITLATITEDATIYYTTDESDPTTDSPVYDENNKPTVPDGGFTIKAFATKEGMTDSEIAEFTYTTPQVEAPTADPLPGEVAIGTEITLTTATSGATIYYTTDGSDPTTGDTSYDDGSKPTVPEEGITIKAFAVKEGMADSNIAEFTYTTTCSGPAILSITHSPDQHQTGQEQIMELTVHTVNVADNTPVQAEFVDGSGNSLQPEIKETGTFKNNSASFLLTIPPQLVGNHQIKATVEGIAEPYLTPYRIIPYSLEITQALLPIGVKDLEYTGFQLTATGGIPPYAFTVTDGNLPPGLTLADNGLINGTPTTAGTNTFTITVADSDAPQGTDCKEFSITIYAGLALNEALMNDGTINSPYSHQFTALGGQEPYVFSLIHGDFPDGLTMDNQGLLSGTPTTTGDFTFTIEVTDSADPTASSSHEFTLSIYDELAISQAPLPDSLAYHWYEHIFTATGGKEPYSFSHIAGDLPDEFDLEESSGMFSGHEFTDGCGVYTFTIQVTDSKIPSTSSSHEFTFTVWPMIGFKDDYTIPRGQKGIQYEFDLNSILSGGFPPIEFSFSGNLPPGLSLSPEGNITGIPTDAGDYTFTLNVCDSYHDPKHDSTDITIPVNDTLALGPGMPPAGKEGEEYSHTFSITGGQPPYHVTVFDGELPQGLSLTTDGVLTGTPNETGTYNFTVTVTDSFNPPNTDSQGYSLTISPLLTVEATPEAGDKIAGEVFAINITLEHQGSPPPDGNYLVKISSDLDGQVFAPEDCYFTGGEATVTLSSPLTTADSHTLTVEVESNSCTIPLTLLSAEPNELKLVVPPGTATANSPIPGPPTVALVDEFDNIVIRDDVTIIASVPGDFISGTTGIKTDSQGLAPFDDLILYEGYYDLSFSYNELVREITNYRVGLEGEGTQNTPFLIRNLDGLDMIRDDVSAYYQLENQIDASATGQEGSPYWNDGKGWVPIADFSGTLDGWAGFGANTIKNLTINRPIDSYVGIFANITSAGSVMNVGLKGIVITGNLRVGTLAGENEGTIENISIYAGDFGENLCIVNGLQTTGGLIGNNKGSVSNVTASLGNVTGSNTNTGGLVGYNSGQIFKCTALLEVSGGTYTGGLVGTNDNGGTIVESKVLGGSVTGSDYVGGLCGFNGNNIEKCHSTNIEVIATGVGSTFGRAGGLVGHNTGKIELSFATNNVTGTEPVGGLVGSNNNGEILNCYARGDVEGDVAGGLVGNNFNNGEIIKSYSTGSVTGNTIGGLIASNQGTVQYSYFDKETAGIPECESEYARSTAEMKDIDTYSSWNFTLIWSIHPSYNAGYPYLQENEPQDI